MPSSCHYLPTPVDEVVELVTQGRSDAAELTRVVDLMRGVQHAAYDKRWQAARHAFDSGNQDRVLRELRSVLVSANYTEVPREVVVRALGDSAVSRVKVDVDLEAFEELVFYRRAIHHERAPIGRWKGWKKREIVAYDSYDKLAMYCRLREAEWFTDRGIQTASLAALPGSVHLKMFQEVPEPDLEMVLPGIEVTMRRIDKVILGVPALVSGLVVAFTKMGSALVLSGLMLAALVGLRSDRPDIDTTALVTLMTAAIALGSFLWRQWTKIKTKRFDYLQRLSSSLYTKTIADGPRVVFSLLDDAEDQDLKEALLAYRALLDGPASQEQVCAKVEGWLDNPRVHFEVDDALARVEGLELASRSGDTWTAVPPAGAVRILRDRWRRIGDELAGTASAS